MSNRRKAYFDRVKVLLIALISEILFMYKFEDVFSFKNLDKSYKKCLKGVSWKKSVQTYKANNLLYTFRLHKRLTAEKYRSKGFKEFILKERGKIRNIKSVEYEERVVQKTLCDFCLNEVVSKKLIYDNGASLKGKGYHFSLNRFEAHLKKFHRKNSNSGYILLFDFKKYFDNISHEYLIALIEKMEEIDYKIKDLIIYFIKQFGSKGLGLGSQVSQILSLLYANELDNYIKHNLKIKHYGRYMDDGYIIYEDKEYLRACLNKIKEFAKKAGITLNEKKTHIVKLSSSFVYLKVKWLLLSTGKVIRYFSKASILRAKRKYKKLRIKLENNKIEKEDILLSFNSWVGNLKHYNSYFQNIRIKQFFNKIYKGAIYV